MHQPYRVGSLPGLALPPGGAVWTQGGAGGHHLPHSPTKGENIKYLMLRIQCNTMTTKILNQKKHTVVTQF